MADPGFFCHFPHPAWPGSTKVQRILSVHKIVIIRIVVVQDSSPALVPRFDSRRSAEPAPKHAFTKLSSEQVFKFVIRNSGPFCPGGSSRGSSAPSASSSSPAASSSSTAASSSSAASSPSAPSPPPPPAASPPCPSALPIPFPTSEFPFDFPFGFFGLHHFAVVVVSVNVILVRSRCRFGVGIGAASAFRTGAGSRFPTFWWR